MKILENLVLKRYETKKNNEGYFCFGISLGSKEFLYLQTNHEQRESIKDWKNNLSSGYKIKNQENQEKYVLFSITGISLFDLNWNNRINYELDRGSYEYKLLEKLERSQNLEKIEKLFYKIIK